MAEEKKQKLRYDRILLALAGIVIVAIAAVVLSQPQAEIQVQPQVEATPEASVEPTPEPTPEPEPVQPAAVDLCGTAIIDETIASFLADPISEGTNFSISYQSLTDGCTRSYQPNEQWLAASTAKVAIALLAFETIAQGGWSLDTWITYDEARHFEGGAGPLQFETEFSGATVGELVELMITQSDNIATNMLLSQLGWTVGTQEYIQNITGIASQDVSENIITAEQQRLILNYLLQPQTPGHTEILTWMYEASDRTRLAATTYYDGTQPAVAHKIGDYADETGIYIHDIAIVDAPKPYILTIMTSTTLEREAVYEQITELGNRILELHYN